MSKIYIVEDFQAQQFRIPDEYKLLAVSDAYIAKYLTAIGVPVKEYAPAEPVIARIECGEFECNVFNPEGDKILHSNDDPVFSDYTTESEHQWLKDVAPGRYRMVVLLLEAEQ